jgi:hypothetical protein
LRRCQIRTIGILTKVLITENDLREFVLELGGEWRDEYGIRQGNIWRGSDEVILTLEPETLLNADDHERTKFRRMLGGIPRSYVVLGAISNVRGTIPIHLLTEVAERLAQRWSGMIDWVELDEES